MKIAESISLNELKQMSSRMFGDLVKAVVDVKKQIMAVDAEMHADEEAYLLERGSAQNDLWGINIYPDNEGKGFVEFDSMINIRPNQNNRSRSVDDPKIQKMILEIVNKIVSR